MTITQKKIASVLHKLNLDAAHCFDDDYDRVLIANRFADALKIKGAGKFVQACLHGTN